MVPPLQRQEVGEPIDVFRFVRVSSVDNAKLRCDFLGDAERGKPARGRARKFPELHHGISVFRTMDLALQRWNDIAKRAEAKDPGAELIIGEYIATTRLAEGFGFMLEDLGQDDGHMTIWGDPDQLAECVTGITPARD